MFTRNSIRSGLCILLCLLAFAPWKTHAQSKEYQIKAAFLFNFAQFTQWPADAFATTNSPFVIGVLGDDPFGGALEETVQGEMMDGRKFVVEHYRRVEDARTCQILFISQSESKRLDEIVAGLVIKPILTVSDIEDAANHGVGIQFFTENNKMRFRINMDSLKNSNLTMSSKLLRVAEIVTTENK